MKPRLIVWMLLVMSISACNLGRVPNSRESPSAPPAQNPSIVPTSGSGTEADIIFHNGHILSMNRAQPTARAIYVRGETVQAVGSNDEILPLAGPQTQLVDLGGLTLMPGFVDAHTHLFKTYGIENTDATGAQTLALSHGVTSIGELAGGEAHLQYLRDLGNEGQMRLRVSIYASVYNEGCEGAVSNEDWHTAYPPGAEIAPRVRMGGIKIYVDGSGCVPPAVSFEYTEGGGHGTLFFESPEQLAAVLKIYYDQGYQLAIHTLGDRAIEQVQQAISLLPPEGRDFNHFRTEHTAVIRPELMKGFTDLGIVGVLWGGYPTCFVTNRTDQFKYFTPDDYLDWEWPWKSLLEANPGGHFAYHSDAFGVTSLNPFDHLMGLTTRREISPDGTICEPPPMLAENKITIEQALEIMTLGGAYALDQEKQLGSLEAGKLADLIVLSHDPLTTQPEAFKETQVYVTLVGGKVEYCAAGHEALCPSASPAAGEPALILPSFSSPVTASAEVMESPASNAVDANLDTVWNSGQGAEQWIILNLGAPQNVRAIRLHVAQYPAGNTVHQVWIGADSSSLTLIHEFNGATTDNDVLEFVPSAPLEDLQYLKVVTTQSPSWVAWREIEVIGE